MDVMSWSRHFRCFPGQGDFPMLEFMDAVLATGYEGLLSLEIFNDQFRAGSARGVAVDGQRSLVYLMDQMRGRAAAAQVAAQAVPPLPPRAPLPRRRVSRIRRRRATPRPIWHELFAGLGFSMVGEHKSKAVTRWSQGSINLVLNCDQEGFAHAHQITHGPSVCAICLKVDSAAPTLDRAQRLRDTPFRQPVGPGELEIPSGAWARRQPALFRRLRRATSGGFGTSISTRRSSLPAKAAPD